MITDEPTSVLDVSTRTQILNNTARAQQKLRNNHHDNNPRSRCCSLYERPHSCDVSRKKVEVGTAEEVIRKPRHPYTMALVSSSPSASRLSKINIKPIGEIASQINIPKGCRFHPRCPFAMEICRREEPPYFDVSDRHISACWLHGEHS
ncbi:MAG TPA: ABC transporter ATP-binding protein [Sulfolobales archaeon]|nr:ABC transporter ATP-binding protein [Sulfolobales archaeon]